MITAKDLITAALKSTGATAEETTKAWEHFSDKELAADIRSRIAELNDMLAEAHARDMIVDVRTMRPDSLEGGFKPHPTLKVTTSHRI